ncbi:MAG: hypothetical protein HY350_02500, partial [Candidatus Omnitrophica bacterium]|nr:hypothetical protein [Candidatus Omnitrophota bacterium]
DYLVASEVFAHDFGGDAPLPDIARKLLKMGPRVVVITRGKEGALCVTADDEFFTPAFSVRAVDTTGAGDVFHGGFIYGLLQEWGLKKVMEFASAVAALKCLKLGGRAGIPTRQEVEEFLKTERRGRSAAV